MKRRILRFPPPRTMVIFTLMAVLLCFSTTLHADDMKSSKYYTMTSYTDHLNFSVLLTDLYFSNTWAKDGYIKAVSGNQTYKLVTVYTKEMSSDYNENYNVFANNELKGGVAYLSNANGGAAELGYSNEQFWVWKGSDNDRTYAKIDYYYPPELANKTWEFYYYYKHNNGSWYNMKLGSAYCSPTMGLKGFDANDFSIERTDVRKMEVTLPALPDDVPVKLKNNRKHVGKYSFTFTYHLYDGATKLQKETFDCETMMEKTYSVDIPAELANFKSVDISADVQDALYCTGSGTYFWNNNSNVTRSNNFPSVPQPENLNAEYLQFDRKVDLAWQAFHDYGSGYQYIEATVPYVYRLETDRNGQKVSGENWKQIAKRPNVGTTQAQTFADNSADPNKYYRYLILNIPKSWAGAGIITDKELESPSDYIIAMLGHVESGVVDTHPAMDIYDLEQDMKVEDKVVLNWKYSRVPVSSNTVRFQLLRRVTGTSSWGELATVQGEANPASGTKLSYTDKTIASNRVRYDYKVRLSINDDANIFESDVLTAGVVAGSTVTALDATKGQHSDLVRVTWKVKQVGTADTNFELYRRYVNSGSEYMKIYATCGADDSYTYEDNTAQPGYYYEYKIEAYAGDKDSYDDTSYQNALTAIGFCQSTGVISGRVTFGSAGTSVEDVRLTLRGSDTGEGGDMQQFSQRVNGASTGIQWVADSAEVAKLFCEKDYTVQLFVRPDENLSEGAVIAEIPDFGRLRLGSKVDDGYKLYVEKFSDPSMTEMTFTDFWRTEGVIIDVRAEEKGEPNYYCDLYDTYVYTTEEEVQAKRAEIRARLDSISNNSRHNGTWIPDIYGNTDYYMSLIHIIQPLEEPISLKTMTWKGKTFDSGLTIPSNVYSLVTLQNSEGAAVVSVGDSTAAVVLQSPLSTKDYTSIVGGELDPKYHIYENRCLYTFDGVNLAALMAFYSNTPLRSYCFPTTGTAFDYSTNHMANHFSVGGATGMEDAEAFRGNLCEVRVWDHVLTDKERANTNDRILSGNEPGLKLYWPMSEGIDRLVVDASLTNDVLNGRHGTVGSNIKSSTIVPSDNTLSRYAVTNSNGEYTLRGIPFIGSGSTYTLTPTKSIHVFSPTSRNGFVSGGSLTLNNYDFTDQSSFTVRGKVTYKDTSIPADSIMFKVDGAIALKGNTHVMTDMNGNYELSVPIGSHSIEAYKEGHVFSRFPSDGATYPFYQDEIINFFDSTLVNVTGRINGGFSDKDAPLGFRKSVNRLGKATLKLSLGKESQASFNYIIDKDGNGEFGKTPIPVKSATSNIQSTAYRAGGSLDDTYYVYIKTDSLTGEFSAMLPPLRYVVNSITFDGGNDYDNEPVFKDNLPVIDATNTIPEKMMCDSLQEEHANQQYYYYSAKLIRQLRTEPTITVTQNGMENGAFGERSISVRDDITREPEDVPVLNITPTGYQYLYGYPIFQQGKPYEFTITVDEQYKNLDTEEMHKEVPQDAVVSITNEASTSAATIVAQVSQVDGKELQPGDVFDVDNIDVLSDEEGKVAYGWIAGFPNLAQGYLRNLTISVNVNGRTTMWHAPDSHTDALDMVVTGGITTGNNFVTGAPDHIDMILRRPPGSSAYAQWSNDSVYVRTKTVTTTSSYSIGGGTDITFVPTIEYDLLEATVFKKNKNRVIAWDNKERRNNVYDDIYIEKEQNTYSVSTAIKTPTGKKYVQNNGDTYIGRASNLLFGKGRYVGLLKQDDGTYKLGDKTSLCTSLSFKTTFVLPQQYVIETLIPNWKAIIKSRLKWVPALTDDYCKTVEGEVIYYTTLKEGDYGYGTANSDSTVWSKEQYAAAGGHPSYWRVDGIKHTDSEEVTDSVEWANQQINAWVQKIRENEKDKLTAFDDEASYKIGNFSIASGTSVSQTTKETIAITEDLEHTKTSYNITSDTRIGATFNDVGAIGILNYSTTTNTETVLTESITETRGTTWQISDASPFTALSVDVFQSPFGYGPIFRTRGGQTCNPYEGATYTKYYQKDTELDKATMRVENPKLSVDGAAELSDVPTGTKAVFKLQLTNESETNTTCNYVLEVLEGSNPNGAILTIDGQPIGNGKTGRTVRLGGRETIYKTLYVEQSSTSIIDYEDIRLVLRSVDDVTTQSDPVVLKVHFVPSSATVDISVDNTVLNMKSYELNKGVIVTVTNLNRQDPGLEGLRLQYRRKGLDTWSLAKEWKVNPGAGETRLPDGKFFTEKVSFLDDGVYELRGQTFGYYGSEGSTEVTYATDIIEVTQDLRGPKILGNPYPEWGELSYDIRNQMHVRFNETINTNALSKTENFRIVGNINNAVTDAKVPDVALQLNGDEITTQSTYQTGDSDLAVEGWFYRQSDGSVFSLGTEDNMLELSTRDGGKITARIGEREHVFESDSILPANIWNYIAMSLQADPEHQGQSLMSAIYINADMTTPVYIVKDQPVVVSPGEGKLQVGGNGMKGMMRDLAIWNVKKTVLQMYQERNELKANYTPGLIGYWRMDEGHGTTLVDRVRSCNMVMPTESWYINNRNLATHLDGSMAMDIDVSTFMPRPTDNFAVELWFRAEKGSADGELLDLANGMSVRFRQDDLMLIKTTYSDVGVMNEGIDLSDVNYKDNQWHHFAMNVRRGANAIFYIDGQAVKTIPETEIPVPNSQYFSIGDRFKGDIDEIRIWNGALTGNLIADRRYERLNSSYVGLIGYFPMERIHRDESGHVTTSYTMENLGDTTVVRLEIINADGFTQATNAPALLPGSQRLTLDENEFYYVASDEEIYFSFPDNMLPRMDGNEFTVVVTNVKDLHGNNSELIAWKVKADFALLNWANSDVIDIVYDRMAPMEIEQNLYNLSSSSQSYEILNLPTWLTVQNPVGICSSSVYYPIKFTLHPSAPIGTHTLFTYVSDCNGIKRSLCWRITVKGDEPNWSVTPSLYESSMAMVGQLYVADKICENPLSKIAAFDDLGTCRGVAHPEYMDTRDAYYLNMYVYGNSDSKYNKLTFKLYDASTGITYPMVHVMKPDRTVVDTLDFASDALFGTYDNPFIFKAAEEVQQMVQLPREWSWRSIYVQPQSTAIADVLPKDPNLLKQFKNIKGQFEFSSVDKNGNITGEVTDILPGKMYKMQLASSLNFIVIGTLIDVTTHPQVMHYGYNWIGTISSEVMSPAEAFADLNPEKNDMVKNRSQVALYKGDGIWEGTLQSIVPGEGYIYLSNAKVDKTFHYPKLGTQTTLLTVQAPRKAPAVYFMPVDPYTFPDNMNVIAVVQRDGQRLSDAEVAAFVNGECRGAIRANEGSEYYFLTVMGSSSDDQGRVVELRVFVDGTEYTVDSKNTFVNDNVLGDLDNPYVLDLDEATGVKVLYSGDDLDDEGWYTLQGHKLKKRPSMQGVYIHKGVKVVIK
ncbi:MAG: hypothetical protein IKQ77_00645 [Prevotella sp.]|nr:hypothetical protein [Prevotella sp.]